MKNTMYNILNEFNSKMILPWYGKAVVRIIDICRKEIVPTMLSDFQIQFYFFLLENNYSFDEQSVVVEIGSYVGGSTFVFSKQLTGIGSQKKIYSIDPHKYFNENTTDSYNKTLEKYDLKNVIPIYKTSDEQVKDFNSNIDFLFIDGNHTYNFVKRDLQNWGQFVNSGGTIVLHDFHTYGVKAAFEEYFEKNQNKIEDFYVDSGIYKDDILSSLTLIIK